MRTLFLKTLLWFLGTAIFTMAAIAISAALTFNQSGVRPPIGMLMMMQLGEARHSYEAYGREGLARAIRRFERITQGDGIFTDAQGIDLLTGEDRSDLIREANRPLSMFRRNRAYLASQTSDGKYWYFLALRRQNWLGWLIQPRNHLIILAILLLLCYGFARHLTKPVQQLQRAVERFGNGDLSARVSSKRKDELGELARSFDQMADRIQTLLAAERRLLLDISHELRSPLARLSVAVELARSSPEPEPHLNRIEKEADRLNALVGELLQVTRAEGDPEKRRSEPVNLAELLEDIIGDSRIEAEARGCRIELAVDEAGFVKGDEELLRRAIENVVRNAVRYEPGGSAVEVRLTRDGTASKILVRDHGPGVPAGDETRIFDAFYRVDPDRNRATGGAGLGLSIAKRAIELHNGQIRAHNASPGLAVELVLPA